MMCIFGVNKELIGVYDLQSPESPEWLPIFQMRVVPASAPWRKLAHLDRKRALAALARRYLRGCGPTGERNLAKWAGLPLRDARAGLIAIASALDVRADGLFDLAGRAPAPPLPPPWLLGAFDPLLLGWVSREPLLGSNQNLVTSNGRFRPFALVRGRAAATWSLQAGKIALEPFRRISRRDLKALKRD
jgi:hypothetical protein